jgi:putative polyketide hydroxylase
MSTEAPVDVLVIGAGVVGLSTALFLLRAGVRPLVVERHPGTSIHPRARGVNVRTMELFRAVALEDRVREAGRATPIALGLISGRTLAEAAEKPLGRQVRRLANWFAASDRARPHSSPVTGCRVTQDHLEPALAAACRERGAEVRFSSEVVDLLDDGEAVAATVRPRGGGAETAVRARYVVAADGARSPTRVRLGLGTTGRGSLGHLLNILFEADLGDWVPGRAFSLGLVHGAVDGLFASIDNRSRWVFHLVYDPAREPSSAFTPERCAGIVREALGLDRPVRVSSVLPWECAARVAERYRVGRIFLAGDAAHLMPPWGGQGANSGIADGFDLAWKLGLVLRGDAPDRLLDTYESERRPVGVQAAEESADRADPQGLMAFPSLLPLLASGIRGALFPPRPPGPSALHKLSGLGYEYGGSAISSDDVPARRWSLDGRPGTRVPHAEVERGGVRCSTLDLVTPSFALWSASPEWWAAAGDLDVVRFGADVTGDAKWRRAAGIGDRGALLVRPDGFVAWRSTGPGDPRDLRDALARATGNAG